MTDPGGSSGADGAVGQVDPFDLPEWLGVEEVGWTAASALADQHRVRGRLDGRPDGGASDGTGGGAGDGHSIECDLLAVDQAWPRPVVAEEWRRLAHGEWIRGEVLLLRLDGRLTLAFPGTAVEAGRALEAVGRLARAVGVPPARFLVTLRP
ncbi:MAG TPA: hypothetical protein VI452_09130 [Marmoricola sp.]